MWVRQLGQNQSICLNLTQQNGDKDFSAKHDKSVIEGKEIVYMKNTCKRIRIE